MVGMASEWASGASQHQALSASGGLSFCGVWVSKEGSWECVGHTVSFMLKTWNHSHAPVMFSPWLWLVASISTAICLTAQERLFAMGVVMVLILEGFQANLVFWEANPW